MDPSLRTVPQPGQRLTAAHYGVLRDLCVQSHNPDNALQDLDRTSLCVQSHNPDNVLQDIKSNQSMRTVPQPGQRLTRQ